MGTEKQSHDIAARMTTAWNAQRVEPVLDLYAEGGVLVHPMVPTPLVGRAAIGNFEGAMFGAFSGIEWKLCGVVGGGDRVAVEYEVSATNTSPMHTPAGAVPATGKRISIRGTSLLSLDREGRVLEERRYFDTAAMFRQLGLG